MFTKCTVPFGQTFPSSQQFVANQTTPRRRSIYSLTSSQFIPALKEWAPLVAAVRQGDQTVLFRKGGIREPTFAPRAPNFLLFPTAYHTESSLLKPDVRSVYEQDCRYDPRSENVLTVSCIVKTTGLWSTTCGNALSALGPLHICGPEFLDKRLKWRPSQSLTVMQVRAYRYAKNKRQSGCWDRLIKFTSDMVLF
jgi:hypothetical protein